MAEPFKCPKCGASDYVVLLTGCTIKGATLQEEYVWDKEAGEYVFGGSMLVESETLENEAAHAVCAGCEADVTDAVKQYEESQPEPGDGEVQA